MALEGFFELTEDQRYIRDAAREFAERELAPGAAERDEKALWPTEQLKKMWELGFMGLMVPEEYGGIGADTISYVLAMEEIARVDAAISTIMSVQNSLVCEGILKFGTEEQKRRYLPQLTQEGKLGAYALTEPQAGSDAAALRTTAVRDGDHYVLNGTKAWITNAPHADYFLVYAVTDKEKRHHGITAFLVDAHSPGVKVGKPEEKLGIRASHTAMVYFEDCRVPVENRLGEEGQGFKIAMAILDRGRIGIAAQALGIARASLEAAVSYAREREAFGGPIANLQAIQFMIADVATRVQAARWLIFHAAYLKDRGEPFTKEASMAKLFASETASFAADVAIQVHGGNGYSKEYPVERYYRDARITRIYEGTSEIQRLVIGRHVLGLRKAKKV